MALFGSHSPVKSYSFKTRKEALDLEKTVKKLFKKKNPTRDDFKNRICDLCPHKCTTCTFCWGMFYKFKNTLVDYNAPLTILKTLISAHYDGLYVPTFYFLKTNICNICVRYGQGCNTIAIGDACPSKYLVQMDSNESAKLYNKNTHTYLDTDDEFSEYDYMHGRTYPDSSYNQRIFYKDTKPELSITGKKMQELINKLFEITENEHT